MTVSLCRACASLSEERTGACVTCGGGNLLQHDELLELAIAHVDCDAFYASVEKRDDPSLEDRPLIVGDAGGRGVVTTACYLARLSGVHSAMAMFRALELCPDAVVISPDMGKYKAVSAEIRAIFCAATPVIEPVSLDEAYLDLTPECRSVPEEVPAVALARIARRVRDEIGVTVSVGLSHNKFLAKLASEQDKPDGFTIFGRAEAEDFLARLSVRKIHGVGAATAKRLESAGMFTVADVRGRPEQELVGLLGRFGRRLKQFAHAEDQRSVTPQRASKSISAETTFREDVRDAGRLNETASQLCARVAEQLRRKGLACGAVSLKLKTSDFRVHTRNRRLEHPTQRDAVLCRSIADLLAREVDGRSYRLIGVGVTDLRSGLEADPPGLFDPHDLP